MCFWHSIFPVYLKNHGKIFDHLPGKVATEYRTVGPVEFPTPAKQNEKLSVKGSVDSCFLRNRKLCKMMKNIHIDEDHKADK